MSPISSGSVTVMTRPTVRTGLLTSPSTARRPETANSAAANRVEKVPDFGDVGRAVVGEFPDEALAGLRNARGVRYVEPDLVVTAHAQPTSVATTPWTPTSSTPTPGVRPSRRRTR